MAYRGPDPKYESVTATESRSGADVPITAENTSNTASSTASVKAKVAGTSAGDAVFQAIVNGTTTWTMGVDNSDSDKFKINAAATLGSGDAVTIGTDNAVTLAGALTANSIVSTTTLAANAITSTTTLAANSITSTTSVTGSTVVAQSYVNLPTQAAVRFNDDSGGEYVALQAPTGVTTHTLKLPAAQGSASTVLMNDGSGNLSWSTDVVSLPQNNIRMGNSSGNAQNTNIGILGDIIGSTAQSTVTITIASPGVVSYTSHGLSTGDIVYLTTTGALPTGLTATTRYAVVRIDANSFSLASTLANAHAGTSINTTGSQSGVHTLYSGGLKFQNVDAKIPGKVSGNNDSAGYVGEFMRSTVTSSSSSGVTAGQFGNVTSLTLTKGHWLVWGTVRNTRVSGQAELTVAISTNSANTTSDHISGYTEMTMTALAVGAGNTVITLLPWDQSISTSTTYYLKAKLDAGTWSTGNFVGTIFAMRMS